jgi:hypothetical protein
MNEDLKDIVIGVLLVVSMVACIPLFFILANL